MRAIGIFIIRVACLVNITCAGVITWLRPWLAFGTSPAVAGFLVHAAWGAAILAVIVGAGTFRRRPPGKDRFSIQGYAEQKGLR